VRTWLPFYRRQEIPSNFENPLQRNGFLTFIAEIGVRLEKIRTFGVEKFGKTIANRRKSE